MLPCKYDEKKKKYVIDWRAADDPATRGAGSIVQLQNDWKNHKRFVGCFSMQRISDFPARNLHWVFTKSRQDPEACRDREVDYMTGSGGGVWRDLSACVPRTHAPDHY